MYFKWNRSNRRLEIIQSALFNSEPISKISRVRESSGQTDDSNRLMRVAADKVGSRDDDLQNGTTIFAE